MNMRLIALALALCFALAPMQGATRPAKVKSHAVKSKSRAVKSKVVKGKKNPKAKGRKAPRQPKRTTVTRRSN